MLTHGLHAVAARLSAEAAVHGDAEVVQVARGGRLAPPQAGYAIYGQHDAEEDARVAGLEVGQRPEDERSSLRR